MRFDLEALNPGTWFYFDDDERDGEGVCVRQLNEAALDDIRKKTVTEKITYRRGVRNVIEKVDRDKERRLTIDYCISDWSIKNKSGKPIEPSLENKEKLVKGSPHFNAFLSECLNRVAEIEEQEQKQELEN